MKIGSLFKCPALQKQLSISCLQSETHRPALRSTIQSASMEPSTEIAASHQARNGFKKIHT